jgi:Fur family transcriptional regulator, zinc uptake regulator
MGQACDHDHPIKGLSGGALRTALETAERLSLADGERLTDSRRRVLSLLLTAGEPVKAYDLIARFGEDGQPAKPPTVYRALEFLERRGLAHRIASLSAYVACASGADGEAHAAAFLICDCCGASAEVRAERSSALNQAARDLGYRIDRATVEAHGRCAACLEAA